MCMESTIVHHLQDGNKIIFSIPSSTSNRGGRGRRDRLILAHYRCSRGSVLRCWRERKQSNIVFPFLFSNHIILYEVERVYYVEGDTGRPSKNLALQYAIMPSISISTSISTYIIFKPGCIVLLRNFQIMPTDGFYVQRGQRAGKQTSPAIR